MSHRILEIVARSGSFRFLKKRLPSTHTRQSRRRRSRLSLHEALEPRALMHANLVLDAEHLAVFGLRDSTTGVVTNGLVPDASSHISRFQVPRRKNGPTRARGARSARH
jgi:hypothetical protein